MKDNIIDIELEYFKHKNLEIIEAINKNDFEQVTKLAKEPIEKIEAKVNKDDIIYCPQNVVDATIYMNLLEPKATQENFANINYYDFYFLRSYANYKLKNYEEAKTDCEKALRFHPASSVAWLHLLEINKRLRDFTEFLEDIKKLLKYCYNREYMARAYRDLGYYLYEVQDFEMAIVAYFLSNVYEMSKVASDELTHISNVTGIDIDSKDWLSEESMRNISDNYKISLIPNPILEKLIGALAEDAYNKKAYGSSTFAYKVLYDMTLEEKYSQKVLELQELRKKK